jgi:hypothetical protein
MPFKILGSVYILHQDNRIGLGQIPRKSELKKFGEKLVPGDAAILAFRKRRRQLKVETGQIADTL